MMNVFGRLKPGVPLQQAQADLATVASQLERSYPEAYPKSYGYGIVADPLRSDLTHSARPTLLVLLGAAGFVLLIACANVANLLLSRVLNIERELSMRSALGATRSRIARQQLTESVLLSFAGGALGLLVAPWTMSLLVAFAARFTTRAAEVRMDAPVLMFTTAVAVVTGLLFGLAPALSSSRRLSDSLNPQSGRTTASRGRQRLRSALVVAQVSVSFVLLIGAGLMTRSLMKLQQVNPGFRPDHLLTMRVTPNFTKYGSAQALDPVYEQILRQVRNAGGVESVALVSNVPLSPSGIASGPGNVEFQIEGRAISKGELAPLVDTTVASPDYFDVIGQPLLRGRQFTEHDDTSMPQVAIINETMARHRWLAEDPVGKRVTFDRGERWSTIVGVVGDAKEYGLDRQVGDELYVPLRQAGFAGNVVIRTAIDPMSLVPLIRSLLHDIDPQIAVDRTNAVERLQQDSIASPRLTAMLMGLFAALALLISTGGIAAVLALAVNQRTQELGIRMALGASREAIVGMILRQGFALGGTGIAFGALGAALLTRLLSKLLYGVSPTDASTFGAVSGLFVAVVAIACFVPARQATRLDPLVALRHE
jgi:putative ABC transport system permease protein